MVNNNGRNARQIWQTALGRLQLEVSKSNFESYLNDTSAGGFDGKAFTVVAPNAFVRDWLENRLISTIKATLIGIIGHTVEIRFAIRSGESQPRPAMPLDSLMDGQPEAPRVTRLNPRYTFDSFIVGASNRFAHAAAEAVAAQPGTGYNPLFIYGGVGLGKTHLLHAVGQSAIAQGLTVLYVSSEAFTNEFIKAIRERANEQFRNKYRSVDVLLIDDIQFLAGREQTQEEFFHTFNDLHSQNKQIVISSDRTPKSMPSMEDRLRSRFEWGLITDIQTPDFETRVAILEQKARSQQLVLPVQMLELIAHKVQSNIRELEGSLNKVIVYARSHGLPMQTETAHLALIDASPQAARRRSITPAIIINTVAEYYRIDAFELRGKRRDRDIANPRHIAMHLMREETSCSLGEIGRELGNRDHTTVMHGCEKIATELKTNAALMREINEIRTAIYHRESGEGRRAS